MAQAYVGEGTILRFGSGTATVATTTATSVNTNDVALVTSITPNKTSNPIDVTALDSGGWEQLLMGRKKISLDIELEYDPSDAQHKAIMLSQFNDTKSRWILLVNSNVVGDAAVEFLGYIPEAPQTITENDKITVSFTVQSDGAVTFTQVA